MKVMRESVDILKSLKELTNQQLSLTNEIMRLKRELAGRLVDSSRPVNMDSPMDSPTTPATSENNTPTTTAPSENNTNATTKKRGRGRPRKDLDTVSSLAPAYDEIIVYRDNTDTADIINNESKTLRYVLEGGELFLHNPDNGRLFDIDTRTVVGRYNLYLDRIDWL